VTDQERNDYIRALITERDQYLRAGNTDRAAQVTAELRRIGAEAEPPARKAARR
jgi:hypothetical protein